MGRYFEIKTWNMMVWNISDTLKFSGNSWKIWAHKAGNNIAWLQCCEAPAYSPPSSENCKPPYLALPISKLDFIFQDVQEMWMGLRACAGVEICLQSNNNEQLSWISMEIPSLWASSKVFATVRAECLWFYTNLPVALCSSHLAGATQLFL